MDFYVYAHVRLDTLTVFYVGKGRRNRAFRTERNKHWRNIVAKAGYRVEMLATGLSEFTAFEVEKSWIAKFKAMSQCEANYSNGGEGCVGYKWTKEQRARHSMIQSKGSQASRRGHQQQAAKIRGRTKETHSGVQTISEKNSGSKNGRAIYRVYTPLGVFDTIKEAAAANRCSTALVHKKINRRYSGWKKESK